MDYQTLVQLVLTAICLLVADLARRDARRSCDITDVRGDQLIEEVAALRLLIREKAKGHIRTG